MESTDTQPKQTDADLVRLRMEFARWKKGMKLRPGEQ